MMRGTYDRLVHQVLEARQGQTVVLQRGRKTNVRTIGLVPDKEPIPRRHDDVLQRKVMDVRARRR